MNNSDLESFLKNEIFESVHSQYEQILEEKKTSNVNIYNEMKYLKYSIFYSNPLHTLKKGKIYFMGLNPSGKYIDDINHKCMYEHDNSLIYYKNLKENYCSFIDEFWENEKKEKYKDLQVKVKKVLDYIISVMEYSITVREIFSTNINFIRSKDEGDLFRYRVPFDHFWDYHKKFLEIVKPDIIICNGYGESDTYTKSAFSILKEKFSVVNSDTNIGLNADNNLKYFKKEIDFLNSGKETLVIGINHLSYYNKNYNPDNLFFERLKKILIKNT